MWAAISMTQWSSNPNEQLPGEVTPVQASCQPLRVQRELRFLSPVLWVGQAGSWGPGLGSLVGQSVL